MLWNFRWFLIVLYFAVCSAYLTCNNSEPLYLQLNTVGFFRSYNYPLMSSYSCNFTFGINSENISQKYIISMIYDYTSYLSFGSDIDATVARLSEPLLYIFNLDKKLYKGFVMYETSKSQYPLEFTKNKPLLLDDESQIMYLFSSYNRSVSYRTYPCIWQFTAPPDYGFKIVFVAELSRNDAKLIVENTTDAFINSRSYIHSYNDLDGFPSQYPFYNPDNYIKISLFPGHAIADLGNQFEFEAYVSIIKKNYPKQDKCFSSSDGNTTRWSNYNSTYEIYENNLHCRHTLYIPPNSEVFVSALNFLEPFAEYFIITDEKNISRPFPRYVFNFVNIEFMVFSRNNSHGNSVTFEFLSDGSMQYGGFSITSNVIDCKCGTAFIPCDNQTHFAMPDTPFLCGNLRCNFTLQKCPSRLAFVNFDFDKLAYPGDIFRIISNDLIVYEIPVILSFLEKIYALPTSYDKIINSTNVSILEVVTRFSDLPRTLSIRLQPLILPPAHIVELTDDVLTYIIDIQAANFTHVKYRGNNLSKNFSLILYFNDYRNIEIFDNENFTTRFNLEPSVDNHIKIKTNEFVILQTSLYYYPLFSIVSKGTPKGCVFKKNVIIYDSFPSSVTLSKSKLYSAMSNEEGECPIFLSTKGAGNVCVFNYVWTTSSKENVKVYVGSDQTNLFFEFNSATAINFQYVMLLSDVYTFILPKSSSLLINIDLNPQPILRQLHSIFASPYFGTFTSDVEWTYWRQTFTDNTICASSAKFTIVYYKMSKYDVFYFTACTTADACAKYYPKEIGEVFIFKKVTLNIYYKASNRSKDSGIIFLVESLGFCNCDIASTGQCLI